RLADSVAVLTGARSGRRWARPIGMESILRGAMGRISGYQRIRVHSTSDTAVAGHAAEGVMHALAELLDNAANFSPPTAEVHVYVEEVPAGVIVSVEDSGLVMGEAQLRRAERAVSGESADLGGLTGTRLGLAVVGRLARRYGLRVSYRPSARGGTGVLMLVPQDILVPPEAAAPAPPAAVTTSPPPSAPATTRTPSHAPSHAPSDAPEPALPSRAAPGREPEERHGTAAPAAADGTRNGTARPAPRTPSTPAEPTSAPSYAASRAGAADLAPDPLPAHGPPAPDPRPASVADGAAAGRRTAPDTDAPAPLTLPRPRRARPPARPRHPGPRPGPRLRRGRCRRGRPDGPGHRRARAADPAAPPSRTHPRRGRAHPARHRPRAASRAHRRRDTRPHGPLQHLPPGRTRHRRRRGTPGSGGPPPRDGDRHGRRPPRRPDAAPPRPGPGGPPAHPPPGPPHPPGP